MVRPETSTLAFYTSVKTVCPFLTATDHVSVSEAAAVEPGGSRSEDDKLMDSRAEIPLAYSLNADPASVSVDFRRGRKLDRTGSTAVVAVDSSFGFWL